jgi:hypothetical protein
MAQQPPTGILAFPAEILCLVFENIPEGYSKIFKDDYVEYHGK